MGIQICWRLECHIALVWWARREIALKFICRIPKVNNVTIIKFCVENAAKTNKVIKNAGGKNSSHTFCLTKMTSIKSCKQIWFSKNVCPYEHIEEVVVKEPCLRAYTKYVRTRKIGCNGLLATCTVREPK